MPIAVLIVVRIWRAFAATFRLLSDWQLLRALPWAYIRTLPIRNAWIGMIFAALLITLLATVGLLVIPSARVREDVYTVGLVAAWGGIVSSWLRWFIQWRRMRGWRPRG